MRIQTGLAIAVAGVALSAAASIGVVAASASLEQKQRLSSEAPKVVTPMAYRYEYCYVEPTTGKLFFVADAGLVERQLPSTWAAAVAQLGNEGWELVGAGPNQSGTPGTALWFKRGRKE